MASEAKTESEGWSCEACTFLNTTIAVSCEICGTPNIDAAAARGASSHSEYWPCTVCTIQNVTGTHTCFMCGSVDETQRQTSGPGGGESGGMTPSLLERLATDNHFSLSTFLTELCQELAISSAHAESGISRSNMDVAYVPVLISIIRSGCAKQTQENSLLACRALNYFMAIGGSYAEAIGEKGGIEALLHCLNIASLEDKRSFQELAREAIKGIELLVKSGFENFRRLMDDGQALLIVCAFIESVYGKFRPRIRSESLSRDRYSIDESGNSNISSSATESGVKKGLELLRLLIEATWSMKASTNKKNSEEIKAVLEALCEVLRHGRGLNKETALQLISSHIVPRLISYSGYEYLKVLILDDTLLVAAIEDMKEMNCHLQALSLTFQLLCSSSELCSTALSPSCSLIPVVLGLFFGEEPMIYEDTDSFLSGTNPSTPKAKPTESRAGVGGSRSSNLRNGSESLSGNDKILALSGIAILRIAGLLVHLVNGGSLPQSKAILEGDAGSWGDVLVSPSTDIEAPPIGEERGDRRAKLLADLGNGTCLIRIMARPPPLPRPFGTPRSSSDPLDGPQCEGLNSTLEVIESTRIIMGKSGASFAARARRSLTRAFLSEFSPMRGREDAEGLRRGLREGLRGGAHTMQQRFLKQFVEGGNVSLVKRVLADGADPNGASGGSRGDSPPVLMLAAGLKQQSTAAELVKLLLEHGADPSIVHSTGSALHAAAAVGHEEVVTILLEAGADPSAINLEGITAMDVCADEPTLLKLVDALKIHEENAAEEEREENDQNMSESSSSGACSASPGPMNSSLEGHSRQNPSLPTSVIIHNKAEMECALVKALSIGASHSIIPLRMAFQGGNEGDGAALTLCKVWLLVFSRLIMPSENFQDSCRDQVKNVLVEKPIVDSVISLLEALFSGVGLDSFLIHKIFVLVRILIVECQDVYKVPLRRCGVLHRIELLSMGGGEYGEPMAVIARELLEHITFAGSHIDIAETVLPSREMQLRKISDAMLNLVLSKKQDMKIDSNSFLDCVRAVFKLLLSEEGITPFEALESGFIPTLLPLLSPQLYFEGGISPLELALDESTGPAFEALVVLIQGVISSETINYTGQFPGIKNVSGVLAGFSALSESVTLRLTPAGSGDCILRRTVKQEENLNETRGPVPRANSSSERCSLLVNVQPLARVKQVKEFILRSINLKLPSYIEFCKSIIGGTVRIISGPGVLSHIRDPHMGQEPSFVLQNGPPNVLKVLGFDEETGTHLLYCSTMGRSFKKGYEQLVLAECEYYIKNPTSSSKGVKSSGHKNIPGSFVFKEDWNPSPTFEGSEGGAKRRREDEKMKPRAAKKCRRVFTQKKRVKSVEKEELSTSSTAGSIQRTELRTRANQWGRGFVSDVKSILQRSTGSSEEGSMASINALNTEHLLESGSIVECQCLVLEGTQEKWTSGFYRGKSEGRRTSKGGVSSYSGIGQSYSVLLDDGERVEDIPVSKIRPYRGIGVGSVIPIAWPNVDSKAYSALVLRIKSPAGTSSGITVIFKGGNVEKDVPWDRIQVPKGEGNLVAEVTKPGRRVWIKLAENQTVWEPGEALSEGIYNPPSSPISPYFIDSTGGLLWVQHSSVVAFPDGPPSEVKNSGRSGRTVKSPVGKMPSLSIRRGSAPNITQDKMETQEMQKDSTEIAEARTPHTWLMTRGNSSDKTAFGAFVSGFNVLARPARRRHSEPAALAQEHSNHDDEDEEPSAAELALLVAEHAEQSEEDEDDNEDDDDDDEEEEEDEDEDEEENEMIQEGEPGYSESSSDDGSALAEALAAAEAASSIMARRRDQMEGIMASATITANRGDLIQSMGIRHMAEQHGERGGRHPGHHTFRPADAEEVLLSQGWKKPPHLRLILHSSTERGTSNSSNISATAETNDSDTVYKATRTVLGQVNSSRRSGAPNNVPNLLHLTDLRRSFARSSLDRGIQMVRFEIRMDEMNEDLHSGDYGYPPDELKRVFSPGLVTALDVARGLWGLYQRNVGGQDNLTSEVTTNRNDMWVNEPLAGIVSQALLDQLAVAANALPQWVDALICGGYGFLLPLSLRLRFFRCSSFGVNRSVSWLKKEAASNGASSNIGGSLGGNLLRREVVQVSKEHLLDHTQHIMMAYGRHVSLSSVLEFRFQGEKGLGAGVTASFYSAVAEALFTRAGNMEVPCWVDEDSLGTTDGYLGHPNGLFPLPMDPNHPKRSAVMRRFKLMGRLTARCLVDSQFLPLPLSKQFIRLVLDAASVKSTSSAFSINTLVPSDLPQIYLEPGKIILKLHRALRLAEDSKVNIADWPMDGMPLADWLDAACFVMEDPLSGEKLVAKGKGNAESVTPKNLKFFVNTIMSKWLREGIMPQVQAFVAGCSEAFPAYRLGAFTENELIVHLCGEEPLDWPISYLEKTVNPGAGYTRNSEPFQSLLSCLSTMESLMKRRFLSFVLGCPRLPPGGLGGLSPPLEISRRQQGGFATSFASEDVVNRDLPFARTCTHTLHLPPYSSLEILREKLIYAIENSKDIIDRD